MYLLLFLFTLFIFVNVCMSFRGVLTRYVFPNNPTALPTNFIHKTKNILQMNDYTWMGRTNIDTGYIPSSDGTTVDDILRLQQQQYQLQATIENQKNQKNYIFSQITDAVNTFVKNMSALVKS